MKIKTNLTLLTLTFSILIVLVGLIMFLTFDRINREIAHYNVIAEISKGVSELSILTHEYFVYHERRMLQQWLQRYNSMRRLVEKIEKEEVYPEHTRILQSITLDYKILGDLFSHLQFSLAKRKRLIKENKPQTEIDAGLVLEEREMARIMMRVQKLTIEVFEISAILQKSVMQAQQKANLIVLFSIIVIIVLSTSVPFFVIRGITKPLNKLVKSTEIIGKGDLKHRVEIRTKNEIGELAVNFNQMTENLGKVTASRDELNAANQQLQASEQQLKASNQQLRANEQQLRVEITERKQVEEELEKHKTHLEELVETRTQELVEANKDLESFSYSISHDLRAPLRSMDGFSRILLETCKDKLDDDSKDNLIRVRKASQRMAQLIEDILTLSRVTRYEIKKERVDLSRIAESVLSDLREINPSRRKVEVVVPKGLFAEGDSSLIRLVLENLLGNAWKFTSKIEKASIEFGKVPDKKENVFFVRDNGAGFEMAYADKLFGAFQRLHSEKEFPGTGIGLVSVKRIISRHGGRVWVEGEVEKGATFYFTLPYNKKEG